MEVALVFINIAYDVQPLHLLRDLATTPQRVRAHHGEVEHDQGHLDRSDSCSQRLGYLRHLGNRRPYVILRHRSKVGGWQHTVVSYIHSRGNSPVAIRQLRV